MLYCTASPLPPSLTSYRTMISFSTFGSIFGWFYCFPWGDEVVWVLLFNFLHTVLQLAKFCFLPEFENIPNFSVFFSIYQCHASDFSIKRKKGNLQETMRSEKMPNPRNWKLHLFMCTWAKEPRGKKKNGKEQFIRVLGAFFFPQRNVEHTSKGVVKSSGGSIWTHNSPFEYS